MTTIYILTQGSYSDYHIAGVFSSRKKAEQAKKLYHTNEYDVPYIEEWTLDAMLDTGYPEDHLCWWVDMDSGGQADAHQCAPAGKTHEFYAYNPLARRGSTECFGYFWGRDAAHAIKIANDLRLVLIAENRWPEWEEYPSGRWG